MLTRGFRSLHNIPRLSVFYYREIQIVSSSKREQKGPYKVQQWSLHVGPKVRLTLTVGPVRREVCPSLWRSLR
jgi:hypothetical protein